MAEKKSSPVVWIVLTVGGVLAMLCFGTFLFGGVGFLFGRGGSTAVDAIEAPVVAASGQGVAIPPSQSMTGSPIGLWWRAPADGAEGEVMLFLPDGQFVRNPTLGGGRLADLEASPDKGTFKVENEQMFYTSMTGRFRPVPFAVSDDSISIDGHIFAPLNEANTQTIVATWRDGTATLQLVQGGSFQRGEAEGGSWKLDGYKIDLTAYDGTTVTSVAGLTPDGTLVIDRTAYRRQ